MIRCWISILKSIIGHGGQVIAGRKLLLVGYGYLYLISFGLVIRAYFDVVFFVLYSYVLKMWHHKCFITTCAKV